MSKCFKLNKLPQLPDVSCDGQINFSWPSNDVMQNMQKDQEIKIKNIELWWNSKYLNSVRVTLTNNEASPKFRSEKGNHDNHRTLEMVTDV